MTAEFKQFRNKLRAKPQLRKAIHMLPEWLKPLLNEPRVFARQMPEDFSIVLSQGRVKQPGRSSVDVERCDYGAAGDYEVIFGTDRLAVQRDLFEALFVLEEE